MSNGASTTTTRPTAIAPNTDTAANTDTATGNPGPSVHDAKAANTPAGETTGTTANIPPYSTIEGVIIFPSLPHVNFLSLLCKACGKGVPEFFVNLKRQYASALEEVPWDDVVHLLTLKTRIMLSPVIAFSVVAFPVLLSLLLLLCNCLPVVFCTIPRMISRLFLLSFTSD
jgi:hypothetical protein